MRTTLHDSGGFACLADIRPIPLPVGGHCLTLSTRWAGAKNPDSERQIASLCLDRAGLLALGELVAAALNEQQRSKA